MHKFVGNMLRIQAFPSSVPNALNLYCMMVCAYACLPESESQCSLATRNVDELVRILK